MTAPQLLGYIGWAVLVQVVVWGGLGVWLSRRAGPLAAISGSGVPVPWRPFRVLGRTAEDPEGSQVSFAIAPVDGLALPAFHPGQFLTVTVTPVGQAHAVVRCYSLSDRPEPDHYRITIKRVPAPPGRPDAPPGACSSHFHDHVRVGDTIGVRGPSGDFFLDPDPDLPVLMIAGGIGITPMVSMLRWLSRAAPQRRVHLVHAVRNSAVHAFRDELRALFEACPTFRQTIVYAAPLSTDVRGRDHDRAGHVDPALVQAILGDSGRCAVYVCGPPQMMETLVPALRRAGVAESDLHYEAFGPASVPRPAGLPPEADRLTATAVPVHFLRSGRTLDWTGQRDSLLDFAEGNGIAIESGCRAGQCGSCETRLVSGEVHYHQPPGWAVAQGYCLPCVCTPSSALELDA